LAKALPTLAAVGVEHLSQDDVYRAVGRTERVLE
jgi:hypothetical protein